MWPGCWDDRRGDRPPAARLPPGPVDLDDIATDATPGFDGGKKQGQGGARRARSRARRPPGAAVRRGPRDRLPPPGAAGAPGHGHLGQGRRAASTPSAWSTRRACGSPRSRRRPRRSSPTTSCGGSARRSPAPGYLGVFDRSHYEDVLIARVEELATPEEIERRYDAINEFERELVEDGTVVLKCMLHISKDDAARAAARPAGQPGEALEVRARRHRRAGALGRLPGRRTGWRSSGPTPSTRRGTSYPSDRKWFRNLAVGELLLDALRDWTWAGRPPTSTWTQNGPGCSRRTRAPDPFGRSGSDRAGISTSSCSRPCSDVWTNGAAGPGSRASSRSSCRACAAPAAGR